MPVCSGTSEVGARSPSTISPLRSITVTISAVTLARSDPVGVTAIRSPWRAEMLPAVPMTRPCSARWRLAPATASRSDAKSSSLIPCSSPKLSRLLRRVAALDRDVRPSIPTPASWSTLPSARSHARRSGTGRAPRARPQLPRRCGNERFAVRAGPIRAVEEGILDAGSCAPAGATSMIRVTERSRRDGGGHSASSSHG